MKRIRITVAALAAALIAERRGKTVDVKFLKAKDQAFKTLLELYPRQAKSISHRYANPPGDPFEEVDVEVSKYGVRRLLPPVDDLVRQRLSAGQEVILRAIREYPKDASNIKNVLGRWMRKREIVRVVGAGRA